MKAVVFHFDGRGDWHVLNSAGVRVFCVDERAPHDRVYEMRNVATEAEIAALLGDDPIGSMDDARQPGIEARLREQLTGTPRLAVVSPEGETDD